MTFFECCKKMPCHHILPYAEEGFRRIKGFAQSPVVAIIEAEQEEDITLKAA
jgi:hypothetical protein